MAETGWLLYIISAAILFYMWSQIRTFDLDLAIKEQNKHHVRVHKVLKKHPKGGNWADYKKWMRGKV